MPFKSKAQRAYMYLKHPKIAKRWAEETDSSADLPEKADDKKKSSPWQAMAKKGN